MLYIRLTVSVPFRIQGSASFMIKKGGNAMIHRVSKKNGYAIKTISVKMIIQMSKKAAIYIQVYK